MFLMQQRGGGQILSALITRFTHVLVILGALRIGRGGRRELSLFTECSRSVARDNFGVCQWGYNAWTAAKSLW